MPQLRVEYAKSGRAKCALTACLQTIVKHEVRIGTAVVFPVSGGSQPTTGEEQLSYKWRHLCCFTEKQLQNAKASGDLDTIEGFDDLAPADRELVCQMKSGELLQRPDLKGRVGDVANSPQAAELLPKGASPAKERKVATKTSTSASIAKASPPKVPAKSTRPAKRAREVSEGSNHNNKNDDGDASDATVEFEVVVETSRPRCPYGDKCFRTSAEHMAEYSHGTESDKASPPRRRAVIKGKKH
ncbi:Poly polymerase and DNA-Ligase Zn-finger region family protein [Trypanosoma grayi]|uniref:Poly polymerase and DNA-Ligase Zn-finger region family protein n=1 Tax=Trypanosoma grayi TaxID=71804 RepID=UPI0004F3FFC5|nr:Poly polymerase and DNA-Ligase Zn-finger region family protein [Trypanosoma grayi]KEG09765.1 Poly polymerase and DNA-Ligase Zn-finger region family protein [Trypanosoma grayi]